MKIRDIQVETYNWCWAQLGVRDQPSAGSGVRRCRAVGPASDAVGVRLTMDEYSAQKTRLLCMRLAQRVVWLDPRGRTSGDCERVTGEALGVRVGLRWKETCRRSDRERAFRGWVG